MAPAFPFFSITLERFLARLREDYACVVEEIDAVVEIPGCETIRITNDDDRLCKWTRVTCGDLGPAFLPLLAPDDNVTPAVLESVCDALGINHEDFWGPFREGEPPEE